MIPLRFESLGVTDYLEARRVQEAHRDERVAGRGQDLVFFCQHPPIITLGKRGGPADLAISETDLWQRGIALEQVTRGGEATAHNPGQLVVYPVIALRERHFSVREFVLTLLECAATVASRFGLTADAKAEPAGVYVENRKLASVGLQISHGVTNHGMSLNVSNDLEIFSLIVPCGQPAVRATSLAKESGRAVDLISVENLLEEQLSSAFAQPDVQQKQGRGIK